MQLRIYRAREGCKYYDRENNLRFSLFYDLLSSYGDNPNTYLTVLHRDTIIEGDNDDWTQLSPREQHWFNIEFNN